MKFYSKCIKQRFLSRVLIISLIMGVGIDAYTQVVNAWLTKGDQSVLLQQQPSLQFSPYFGGGTTITVNSNTAFQEIDGFGFCLTQGSAQVINGMSPQNKVNLLNKLFSPNGLNMSMLRISIGASDLSNSTYTYNETPGDINMNNFNLSGPDLEHLVPLLQEIIAINPFIKILATPWTAPTWMKTNNTWIGGQLNPTYYQAYANYFLKYLQAMDSFGITIWGITPQNEPENPFNEPSMLMASGTQINFINNYLGPTLDSSVFSPKIIAFDHNCDNINYPIDVLNNSSYVEGAAFHLYDGDISALSTVKNATDKNVYFTEQYTNVFGDFDGDLGWHMENVVMGSLNNYSKCVLEWNLATDASYGPRTPGGCTDCLGALTIQGDSDYETNVSYYIIGHLSKFIQPGAVKIDVNTNSSQLFVTGFKNPDNSMAILAYNYWGGENDTEEIQLVIGTQKIDFSIPPRSVVTFSVSDSGQMSIGDTFLNVEKELVGIFDIFGRKTDFIPNTPLIYIYSDGSSERLMKLD